MRGASSRFCNLYAEFVGRAVRTMSGLRADLIGRIDKLQASLTT